MEMPVRKNSNVFGFSLILGGLVFAWTGAARAAPTALEVERDCKATLIIADRELEAAKMKSPAGSWYVTKAAGLLGAAKTQQEFGKYPNCVDKVRRARRYLRKAAAAG
jgi:hypothetical protein